MSVLQRDILVLLTFLNSDQIESKAPKAKILALMAVVCAIAFVEDVADEMLIKMFNDMVDCFDPTGVKG